MPSTSVLRGWSRFSAAFRTFASVVFPEHKAKAILHHQSSINLLLVSPAHIVFPKHKAKATLHHSSSSNPLFLSSRGARTAADTGGEVL
jgi:hypothetical protein